MLLSRASERALLTSRPPSHACPVPKAVSRPLRALPGASAPATGAASSARPAFASKPSGRAPAARDVSAASKSKGAPGTVKIVIQGRKLEVTESIRDYVQEKVQRALANVSQEVKEVDVTLSVRGGDTGTHGKKLQKVDITCYTFRNGVVRVEDAEATLYAAIDVVCDKLDRKMTKIKEKAIAKGKWPGRAADRSYAKQEQEQEEREYLEEVIYEAQVFDREERLRKELEALNKAFPTAPVRRYKVMELDPVSVEDAIDEMEQVGHNFFVYRDMESDQIQVVYKRESEGYGVLIPQKRD